MSMIRPISAYVALVVEGLDTPGEALKIKCVCVRCLTELSNRTYTQAEVDKAGLQNVLDAMTQHARKDALNAKAHSCPFLN